MLLTWLIDANSVKLVKSLGADAAFDYNDPDVAKKIREYTKDSLVKVFDCIAEGPALKICEEAISSKGGMIACLRPAKHDRKDVITKVRVLSLSLILRY